MSNREPSGPEILRLGTLHPKTKIPFNHIVVRRNHGQLGFSIDETEPNGAGESGQRFIDHAEAAKLTKLLIETYDLMVVIKPPSKREVSVYYYCEACSRDCQAYVPQEGWLDEATSRQNVLEDS